MENTDPKNDEGQEENPAFDSDVMIVAAVASLKRNAAWKDKPSNAEYFARALNLATQRKPDHRREFPA